MRELQIIYQNQEKIIKKLNTGDVDAIELSVEQITDEFMIRHSGYRPSFHILDCTDLFDRSKVTDRLSSSFTQGF